jgi:hypothetical protein
MSTKAPMGTDKNRAFAENLSKKAVPMKELRNGVSDPFMQNKW